MMKNERGFSLIELIVVVLIFGFVLTATSDMFVGLLRGYKQQSKIAQTNIEGIIGLEMLRRDIDNAGYGLPWQISGITYQEATGADPAYNDASSNPPRAILNGDGGLNAPDYLVIKAVNVARNDTCTKWTSLISAGTVTTTQWTPSTENLDSTDHVIVVSPGTPTTNSRNLIGFSSTLLFSGVSAYASTDETRIVYGVDPNTNLRMPFNRADYYVSTSPGIIPGRCAPGTGVLVKAVVNQSNGEFSATNTFPLLDCVADMQVSFKLDRTGNSPPSNWDTASVLTDPSTGAPLTAQQIRDQLKEVRVDILAHEGQMDTSYTHNSNTILVGENTLVGRNFDLTTIPNWQNYRWKVYTLIVTPSNLR